jgi:hypothetical protein
VCPRAEDDHRRVDLVSDLDDAVPVCGESVVCASAEGIRSFHDRLRTSRRSLAERVRHLAFILSY